MDALQPVFEFFNSLNFSPLIHIIDLNDARSLATIAAAFFAVKAAMNKLGAKAVYNATVTHKINRPSHISNITISNLKDKPLVIQEILIKFTKEQAFYTLQKFTPPLIIKNHEATSITPVDYSSFSLTINPFDDPLTKIEVLLVTNDNIISCKRSKTAASLIAKKMKGLHQVGVNTAKFNGKVFSAEARYAILRREGDKTVTSFLLASGLIVDEWNFRYNGIPPEDMKSEEAIKDALKIIAKEENTSFQLVKLEHNSIGLHDPKLV